MRFDQIGYWSELKLEIVKKYAKAYSTILSQQPGLHHVYIDGFSGAGTLVSKTTGEFVTGSPLIALQVKPPFEEYFLVDLDGDKVGELRNAVGDRPEVHVVHGDCNEILLQEVFPKVRYEDYRRGLCLLDPYGLQLKWEVIETAGRMRTIDLVLNFPIMDMNRNALWLEPERVSADKVARMTSFWGDESWRREIYKPADQLSLFGEPELQKLGNREVAEAFRRRVKEIADFAEVPVPLPMRNSKGAIVYYLFFASQHKVAAEIAEEIFKAYRDREA